MPLIALLLLWVVWPAADDPGSLDEARLAGPRSPAPISAVLWLDESGSFDRYTAMRLRILDQLAQWAPANLRPDDRLTVLAFDAAAGFRLRTTPVQDLSRSGASLVDPNLPGTGTDLNAVMELTRSLRTGLPTTIIAVTDTKIASLKPSSGWRLAQATRATTMTTIKPEDVPVTPTWASAFPWSQVMSADPADEDVMGLAVARALGHMTGQRVVRR